MNKVINTLNSSFYNSNAICRTCLSVKEDLKSIFESEAAVMFNECQFIPVSQEDSLPQYMCPRCYELLLQSFNFKKQCVESQMTLTRFITQGFNLIKERKPAVSSTSELFECKECKERYENEADLLLHQNSHRNDADKHLCTHCNRRFNSLQILKRHTKMHIGKMKYECPECEEIFRNSYDLENHSCNPNMDQDFGSDKEDVKSDIPEDFTSFLEAEASPPLPFPCPECTQSFNAQCDLNLHMSTHTKNGEFICTSCRKQFATRQMLKRHIKTHMLHKPHLCRECGKGFAESHALTKHLRKHSGQPREKKHLCNICGQGFSEPFYLNVHLRKHTGERPLMCSACGKSFADPRSLKAHNMTHTGERPYKCNICGKAFSQSVNLTKHIRVHTGEKPYVCSQCGKCFTQSSSLDKHSRTHTGERPYGCEHCPKRFAEKGTLIHHTRTHTGEKPYTCDQCGKCFASSSELKLHDRKHSGVKKNVCHVCGKDFATPSNLLIHSRTHSGEKPYACGDCGRPFADKGSLKKHLKVHINYKYGEVEKTSEQTFTTLQNLNNNLDPIHTVSERTVDISLNDRLYFNLA